VGWVVDMMRWSDGKGQWLYVKASTWCGISFARVHLKKDRMPLWLSNCVLFMGVGGVLCTTTERANYHCFTTTDPLCAILIGVTIDLGVALAGVDFSRPFRKITTKLVSSRRFCHCNETTKRHRIDKWKDVPFRFGDTTT